VTSSPTPRSGMTSTSSRAGVVGASRPTTPPSTPRRS
jgi:hypothetical protein